MAARAVSEADLIHALKSPEFSSGHLKELVSMVHHYHKLVEGPIRVFPKGIPIPDSIRATFTAHPKAFVSLMERLSMDGRIVNLDVFPLGIPKPDLFQVTAEFR